MSGRATVLRGAALLTAGQAAGQVLSFARNIIVARLLSPEDFGIAAALAITLSLLTMISDLAADKLLIQANDGDAPELQATAHAWQVLRGVASALVLLALAPLIASLIRAPYATWAFAWLALVPLLRGLAHLDVKRLQRHLQFAPATASELVSQAAATALAWPLAHWLGDYSAVLWLVLAQTLLLSLTSHLLAQRRYALAWHRESARRLLAFGWPLLVNGLLLFCVFQGDRAIVGGAYSLYDLGIYSAAAALALAPTLFVASVSTSLALPVLSRKQDDPAEFRRRYVLTSDGLALVSGLLVVLFTGGGAAVLHVVYGEKYLDGAACLAVLGAVQAVRLLRVAPTLAALAHGDSQNSMWANVWRAAALIPAGIAAASGASLVWIPVTALAGELAGELYAVLRLRRRFELPAGDAGRACMLTAVAAGAACLLAWRGAAGSAVLETLVAAAGVMVMYAAAVLFLCPALRGEAVAALHSLRRDGLIRRRGPEAARADAPGGCHGGLDAR